MQTAPAAGALTVLLATLCNIVEGGYIAPTVTNHIVAINNPSTPDLSAADSSADGAGWTLSDGPLHRGKLISRDILWSQRPRLHTHAIAGGGNQRECLLGGLLVAQNLNLCLLMPPLDPVGYSEGDKQSSPQERGTKGRTDYLPPYDRRGQWPRLGSFFDEAHFTKATKALDLCTIPWEEQKTRDHSVQKIVNGSGMWWKSTAQLRSDFEKSRAIHPNQMAWSLDTCFGGMPTPRNESSLCWELAPRSCAAITEALQPAPAIVNATVTLVDRVLRTYPDTHVWDSVHLRSFGCKPRLLQTSAFLHALLPQRSSHRGLYVMYDVDSSDPESPVWRVLHENFSNAAVVTKTDSTLLGARAFRDYPYEVAAQIDFEAANALTLRTGGIYYALGSSSSDGFIVARRRAALGALTVAVSGRADSLCCWEPSRYKGPGGQRVCRPSSTRADQADLARRQASGELAAIEAVTRATLPVS